jgi:hypothetical protein
MQTANSVMSCNILFISEPNIFLDSQTIPRPSWCNTRAFPSISIYTVGGFTQPLPRAGYLYLPMIPATRQSSLYFVDGQGPAG